MTLGSRHVQLGLIAAVQVLGMVMWFSASAVVPALREAWHIGDLQAVWLTASVQVGFVIGAAVSTLLNLPDRFPPQYVTMGSALAAAASTAAVPVLADGFATAVALRLVTGACLAGIYPVGMKLMASWFGVSGRGQALGVLVGALTLGSSLPHLINGFGRLPWQAVLFASAVLGVVAAVVAGLLVRQGPHIGAAGARLNPRYAIEMFRERGPLLANLGYFGHMWELYALWTWLPSFLLAGLAAGGTADPSRTVLGVIAFVVIGCAGAVGAVVGGVGADRYGRAPVATAALVVSGACCLVSPLIYGAPLAVLIAVLLVWGAAVIADSGVFSTTLSEVADHRYVGTALTAQTAIGFLLTVVSMNLVPLLAAQLGWRYAFLLLAPGPVLGAIAMRSLGRRLRYEPSGGRSTDPAARVG
ncbi:MFS transporter [Pseudonocardia asaccharolytica]|uniref:MFS transporter n=1 Tax=Pseudonocardia asaccharolytica DSM 44247 = NBRC 16224 TaxID=1123024 RepID=A0A511CWR9_9PSEU|nr:MFS transporter [Pseudonocardia asaccharolytica]GEL17002.1 MFS transporter [Pseudonocardia asaccharolytica DSM 44247 = NBRC 16224]